MKRAHAWTRAAAVRGFPRLFSADLDSEDGQWIQIARTMRRRGLGRRAGRVTLFTAAGFVITAAVIPWQLSTGRSPSALLIASLVLAYAAAATFEFEVGAGTAVPTQLMLVPMLFLLPLGYVPACVAGGLLLADLPHYVSRTTHPQRAAVLLASSWHAVGPVTVLAIAGERGPRFTDVPIYLVALGAQFAFDFASSASRDWFGLGIAARSNLVPMLSVWAVDVGLAPVGLLVAFACQRQAYAFLGALPLILLFGVFARERRARVDAALELGQAYRGTALLLGDMIEADDEGTGAHSRDVVSLVIGIAERMGLDPLSRRNAEFAALLHDVGKVRVPKEIINKPGPLTHVEWLVIKQHTVWGEEMLKAVGGILGDVGAIVRSCHERYDGTGYPDGRAGDQIPLIARIIFACDAFSAMTTDRSYRRARSTDEAIVELHRHAGSQFDPDVVRTLVDVIEETRHPRSLPLHAVAPGGPGRADRAVGL